MLESILKEGTSPGWLPTYEGGVHGTGTLCQYGLMPNSYYGAKYLPFVKNGINWVRQEASRDIISYNFTGCIMAAFTYEGIRRICHISTGAGQDCLPEWGRIKKSSSNVFEFRPSDFIDTRGGAFVGCYGLITYNFRTFSITVVRDKNQLKISSIKMARLLRG